MSSRLPALSLVGLFALASFAQAATVTSPESGGVTYRIGRTEAKHDNTSSPTWVDIETDGSTWKMTPLAGITGGAQTTSGTARFTLDADGKDHTKGIEVELEAVDAENGNRSFTITFGWTQPAMMMMPAQDFPQADQDIDFDVHSGVHQAINQPFPSDQALMYFNQQASGCTGGGGNCPVPDSGPPDCTDQSCKGRDPYDDEEPYGCEQCRWPDFCPPGICDTCGSGGGGGPCITCAKASSTGSGTFSAGVFTGTLGTEFSVSADSQREYHGSPPSGVPDSPFGNLHTETHRFVSPISGTDHYTYTRGRGEQLHFLKESGGGHKLDIPGNYALTKNGNGTFTVTFNGGQREEYDTAGKLTALVDEADNTWTYSYGTVGAESAALTKITTPDNETYTFTYDADLALVTKADFSKSDSTWTFLYDSSDNLTKLVRDACSSCGGSGGSRTYTYSSGESDPLLNNNPLTVKNADNVLKRTFDYDVNDQVTSADVGGQTSQFNYDTSAGRRTRQDPQGHQTIYYRDGQARLTKVTRASKSTSFIYDDGDQLTKYTLPDGIVVTQLFDDERRLTKETKTKGAQSINRSWLYDSTVDRMTKHTDWRGEDWVYEYDADGNVTKGKYPTVTLGVPSSRQAITTHSFDSLGVMTKTVDPLGVETHLFRASTGLLTKEIRDAGGLALTRILHYDAGNRLTAEVDALSQTTT